MRSSRRAVFEGKAIELVQGRADVIVVDAEDGAVREELQQVQELGATLAALEERAVGVEEQLDLAVILRTDMGGGDLVPRRLNDPRSVSISQAQ